MQSGVKRKYTCSECAKTFRNVDDMHMHAEVCLLDAFEMEAHALLMNPGYGSNDSSSSKKHIHQYGDYQALFRPYVDPLQQQRDKRRFKDEPAHNAAESRKSVRQARNAIDALEEDDDELDFEENEDLEAPPQLEIAEPQQKKYRRIFPIGEDGKQIRPKMECPTCGLVLYRHNFSTHYRIHTGELPFTCSFCDKRFRTSSALTVHTRCHTGDKPYNCPHCDYSCITKRNLDRHIINNHVKRRRIYADRSGMMTYGRVRGRPPAFGFGSNSYAQTPFSLTVSRRRKNIEENLNDAMQADVDNEDSDD